jgi:hypothetical protein
MEAAVLQGDVVRLRFWTFRRAYLQALLRLTMHDQLKCQDLNGLATTKIQRRSLRSYQPNQGRILGRCLEFQRCQAFRTICHYR